MKHIFSHQSAAFLFATVFAAFLLTGTAYAQTTAPSATAPTHLTYIAPHAAKVGIGSNILSHLTAQVKQANGKTVWVGVAGQVIDYRFIDGDGDVTLASVVTDANGYANILYAPAAPGLNSFEFSFPGNNDVLPARANGTFIVSD